MSSIRPLRAVLATIVFVCLFSGAQNARALSNDQLTIGIAQEFESMNPIIQQMSASRYIGQMLGHPLVTLNENWKWVCLLCTEYPTIENGRAKIIEEGGKKKVVVSWEIKANAKWGDGKPVTGHDVKLGWEIGSSPNVAVGEKQIYTNVEAIEVDAANPKKFTTKYGESKYDFAKNMAQFYLIPNHIERAVWEKSKNEVEAYEKQTIFSTSPLTAGLYSGPYLLSNIKLGSHVTLTPNPHFYGKAPVIKKIVVKLIPDTATLEANLLSGTIDMISEMGLNFDQALMLEKRIKQDPVLSKKFDVVFKDGVIYEHIDLQLNNPILKDASVRRALLYAIDRDKLTQALFENRQKKALEYFHPSDPYFTEDVELYNHDPAKAESLLEEAGWKKGVDGYRYKSGQKLGFTLMTTAQDKTRELVEVFLQSEWKKIGIEIAIKNEPARVYFGETVRKGKYPAMALFAWTNMPDNPPRSSLHSENIPTEKNGYSGQNSGGWVNAEADRLLEDVYLEFDINRRKDMMKKLMQLYMTDLPTLPLYMRAEIAVLPKVLKNVNITGHQFYSSYWSENWQVDAGLATNGI